MNILILYYDYIERDARACVQIWTRRYDLYDTDNLPDRKLLRVCHSLLSAFRFLLFYVANAHASIYTGRSWCKLQSCASYNTYSILFCISHETFDHIKRSNRFNANGFTYYNKLIRYYKYKY